MRIVYIADDGKEFNDEFACEYYEWILNHPHLKEIHCYDKDGNELEDICSEDTYSNTIKITVPSENAVKDLYELGRYAGFCCYEDIFEPGEWVFNDDVGTFILSDNEGD